jgi:hypothetical protein
MIFLKILAWVIGAYLLSVLVVRFSFFREVDDPWKDSLIWPIVIISLMCFVP